MASLESVISSLSRDTLEKISILIKSGHVNEALQILWDHGYRDDEGDAANKIGQLVKRRL